MSRLPHSTRPVWRRLHITLIEILIVLSLLALILGIVGLNLGGAARTERFRSGVDILVQKLRLAQDLMLILRTNIRITLEQQEDGLHVTFTAEGALTPALISATTSKTTIDSIHAFSFDSKTSDEKLVLDFLSAGGKMSKGTLTLFSDPNDTNGLKEDVHLAGYPSPIVAGKVKQAIKGASKEESDRLYPSEVKLLEKQREEKEKLKAGGGSGAAK